MTRIDKPEKLPSVDRLLNDPNGVELICEFGASVVIRSVKTILARARAQVTQAYGNQEKAPSNLPAAAESVGSMDISAEIVPGIRRKKKMEGPTVTRRKCRKEETSKEWAKEKEGRAKARAKEKARRGKARAKVFTA